MNGAELITQERRRQVVDEGHDLEHDMTHTRGELRRAALCYMFSAPIHRLRKPAPMWWPPFGVPATWPWAREDWKPSGTVEDLIKAGALIAAEIDRIQALDAGHSGPVDAENAA